jgi:hypothetical protein
MEVLMGKSSINGPFSMAMLNNQRVHLWDGSQTNENIDMVRMDHGEYISSDTFTNISVVG